MKTFADIPVGSYFVFADYYNPGLSYKADEESYFVGFNDMRFSRVYLRPWQLQSNVVHLNLKSSALQYPLMRFADLDIADMFMFVWDGSFRTYKKLDEYHYQSVGKIEGKVLKGEANSFVMKYNLL